MIKLNSIYNEDCLEGLKRINNNSIDLVVTSPPYNIGKEYETRTPIEEYLKWSESYLSEIYRVLKDGRSFMLQVGIYVDKETNSIPLSYFLYPIISKIGFKFRQEIVWTVKGGIQAKKKLTGQHETIMWLYKGKETPYFDLNPIRVKDWKTIDKRNNPNGKNPTNVWDINRVAGNSKEKVGHPCQFPTQMIERITKGWSKEGDTVLDIFMGSGTTAIACLNTKRNYIGFELDEHYYSMILNRIKEHKEENNNG